MLRRLGLESLVNPSARTVPLPLTSVDLAHSLVSSTDAPIAHVVGHWPAFAPYVLTGGTVILFLSAILDWVRERRIHPVSLWGAIFGRVWVLVFLLVIPRTAVWRTFAAWVVQ